MAGFRPSLSEQSHGVSRRWISADPDVSGGRRRSLQRVRLPADGSGAPDRHPSKPSPAKLTEYECGFPAFEDSRAQFDVRFYLVAILFIIFDLEAAFLYPWAVSLGGIGLPAGLSMMLFLAELTIGLSMRGRRERWNGSDARPAPRMPRSPARWRPATWRPTPTSSTRSQPK
jgi:NADH:ubiquinone oxidoreductase subunit 3 (subunit A)